MKKYWSGIIVVLFIIGCAKKKKDNFFPVLSYIKSQVAHVDTSFYEIIKVTWDSTHTDTTYLKREQFKDAAKDFLEIPDLTEKKYSPLYTEEKFFDEGLNRVIFTCKPNNPNSAIIQRQETQVLPDPSGSDKVKSFFIDLVSSNQDSAVEKKLLWKVDQSFQVATLIDKPNQPEITHIVKVIWNDKDEE